VTGIIINPSNYSGIENMEMKIIQQHWILEIWWMNYLVSIFVFGLIVFLYHLCYNPKTPQEIDT